MHPARGFTLIEIAISVFILLIIMLLAIPSVSGVLADRRLQRSLAAMNDMVHQGQERAVHERRPYLIVWQKNSIVLRAESGDVSAAPVAQLARDKAHVFLLRLPAALEKDPLAQWIFWPSGTCEPANVRFQGADGNWEVNYAPLTARPDIVRYAAK
ncbi:MAG: prepilin-type N-terminal cleavage/methylation domain-containing protein [Chthoniobacterales bacterium]|nr:prepilin-type N-terminal cleavage/methylation domain-containing protein [Chthoniobacterales bacterium]